MIGSIAAHLPSSDDYSLAVLDINGAAHIVVDGADGLVGNAWAFGIDAAAVERDIIRILNENADVGRLNGGLRAGHLGHDHRIAGQVDVSQHDAAVGNCAVTGDSQ